MSNNAHELSNRLLNALDNNYNVVDMHTVNEIISVLERINITKELLETTRLGKHVNELRRKTSDPSLARRAKVLVKRWRDLVIPTVASPGHTGSNRSSAERQVRQRLGGTPLTSPALSRVVSPAVASPRPPSRPAWGGYESDSQDVILVDDDPPPPPPPAPLHIAHKPLTPPVKRPLSPAEPVHDEKKAKRDKKPKKRRGHCRAGSGTEATAQALAPPAPPPAPAAAPPAPAPAPPPSALPAPAPAPPPHAWGARNGGSHERRRNGCRRDAVDPYAALVNRMPAAGAKKVKTTKELLEEIQSRGSKPAASPSPPASPASPASPDVMLIEPDSCAKAESPLRNGGASPRPPSPRADAASPPLPPLEDPREVRECTCGEGEEAGAAAGECPAAARGAVRPLHVHALHHVYLPGVNGTRAPLAPHRFAVRRAADPDRPGLFASVVPLYKYSDYADDFCAKNMARVPLCAHLPRTEFAPPPPDPPPPPSPPPIRPYPDDPEPKETEDGPAVAEIEAEVKEEPADEEEPAEEEEIKVEAEMVGVPTLEPGERLKAPLLTVDDETQFGRGEGGEGGARPDVQRDVAAEQRDHRTVERTKAEPPDGRALCELCRRAAAAIPYDRSQLASAPVLTLPEAEAEAEAALDAALRRAEAEAESERDELCRPTRPPRFAEWHECVQLGSLLALPYVVID